jgi:hypothetical protein
MNADIHDKKQMTSHWDPAREIQNSLLIHPVQFPRALKHFSNTYGSTQHGTATYRCDDTRDCIIQFCPPEDEHMCSKHVEAWNKLIIKFSASSWLILRNKQETTVHVESTGRSKSTAAVLHACEASIQKQYEACADTVWNRYWLWPQLAGCRDLH